MCVPVLVWDSFSLIAAQLFRLWCVSLSSIPLLLSAPVVVSATTLAPVRDLKQTRTHISRCSNGGCGEAEAAQRIRHIHPPCSFIPNLNHFHSKGQTLVPEVQAHGGWGEDARGPHPLPCACVWEQPEFCVCTISTKCWGMSTTRGARPQKWMKQGCGHGPVPFCPQVGSRF